MSYEWRKPCASRLRARASASPIVSPATNCSPIIRITRSTPRRTSGSPPFARTRASALARPCSACVATSLPVRMRPHVAALTNSDGLCPTCDRQLASAILSRISASRVAMSGMRNSASARHISATPSCDDNANSWISPWTRPCWPPSARNSPASRAAIACATCDSSGERRAWSTSARTQSGSARRVAAVIASRAASCGRSSAASAANGCVDGGGSLMACAILRAGCTRTAARRADAMVQVDASFAHDWSDRDSATGRSYTPRMPRAAGVSAGLAATMPAGACDCHMHVYARGYPLRPGWTAAVPDAPLAAYRRVQRALGLARTIVVQANAYGFDNTCVENALHELGASARGVATVRPDVADAELARLHAAGFRGARGHLLPGAQLTWRDVATIAARIAPLGWHVQLQFDGRELPERLALIASLPTDVVLDHNGKFLEPVAA